MLRPAWARDETFQPAGPPAWRFAPRLSPSVRGTIKPGFPNCTGTNRHSPYTLPLNNREHFDRVGRDAERHRQFADEFAVHLCVNAFSDGADSGCLQEADTLGILRHTAEHGEGEQPEISQTMRGVDEANLELRVLHSRARCDREFSAIMRSLSNGCECCRILLSTDFDGEALGFPAGKGFYTRVPER